MPSSFRPLTVTGPAVPLMRMLLGMVSAAHAVPSGSVPPRVTPPVVPEMLTPPFCVLPQ